MTSSGSPGRRSPWVTVMYGRRETTCKREGHCWWTYWWCTYRWWTYRWWTYSTYLHPEWPNDVHGMASFGVEALQLRGDTCRPQVSAPIQKHHCYNLSIEHTGAKMRRTCTTPYIDKSPARFSILDPSVYGFKRLSNRVSSKLSSFRWSFSVKSKFHLYR